MASTDPLNQETKVGAYSSIPGQGEELPPVTAGTPLPVIGDEVVSSQELSILDFILDTTVRSPFNTDNPQIPAALLTKTGIKKESVLKQTFANALTKDTEKAEETTKEQAVTPNLWFKYPNCIAAVNLALIEVVRHLSQARLSDAQTKITLQTATFELRKESAKASKEARFAEADKEMNNAYRSITSGVIAGVQAVSIVHARGAAKREAEANHFEKIKEQKNNIQALNDELGISTTEAQDPVKRAEALKGKDPAKVKELEQEEAKLKQLEQRQQEEFLEFSRYQSQLDDARFRATSSFSDGAFSMAGSVLTKRQGRIEQKKGEIEAIIQMLDSLLRTTIEDRETGARQIESLFQKMAQYSADMKANLSTHG